VFAFSKLIGFSKPFGGGGLRKGVEFVVMHRSVEDTDVALVDGVELV
jgi:hypothetical protein